LAVNALLADIVVASDQWSVVVEHLEQPGPVLEQMFFEGDSMYKVSGYTSSSSRESVPDQS
jgi:hypothetical protein